MTIFVSRKVRFSCSKRAIFDFDGRNNALYFTITYQTFCKTTSTCKQCIDGLLPLILEEGNSKQLKIDNKD